jgi:hypothetical protein
MTSEWRTRRLIALLNYIGNSESALVTSGITLITLSYSMSAMNLLSLPRKIGKGRSRFSPVPFSARLPRLITSIFLDSTEYWINAQLKLWVSTKSKSSYWLLAIAVSISRFLPLRAMVAGTGTGIHSTILSLNCEFSLSSIEYSSSV